MNLATVLTIMGCDCQNQPAAKPAAKKPAKPAPNRMQKLQKRADPQGRNPVISGKPKQSRHPEWGQFQQIASRSKNDEASEGGTMYPSPDTNHSRTYRAPSGDIVQIEHGDNESVVNHHPKGNMRTGKRWRFPNKFAAESFRVQKFGSFRNKKAAA